MKRTKTNRPYVRKQRGMLSRRADRLAGAAGLAPRAEVEQLEQRQLLFSLTVTPDVVNPVTGVGTVRAVWGYTIPYLAPPDQIVPGMSEEGDEDFNDEPNGLPDPINNNEFFSDSMLQAQHNIGIPANFQLMPEDPTQTMPMSAAYLNVRGQQGNFFGFRVGAGAANVFAGLTNLAFDVNLVEVPPAPPISPQGLPIANMTVTLLLNGEVIDTYTGAAEIGALNTTNPGSGVGRFNFVTRNGEAFDQIRFDFTSGTTLDAFRIDNVAWTLPPDTFVDLIEGRIFGAEAWLTGPAGTSVQFLDLYGRDMRQTIALGVPNEGLVPLVDRNLDGVPDFNDGIGQIILSNFDERSAFSIWGGTIEAGDPPPMLPPGGFASGGFIYTRADSLEGLFDDFEDAGFGFILTIDPMPEAVGLPPLGGSVIIGSPFVRDNTNATTYNPGGVASGLNFVRSDQGLFALGNQHVGSVMLHAVQFGSSLFEGAIDRYATGYLTGSITFNGDVGYFVNAVDAGVWVPDGDANVPISIAERKTGSQLFFGRTVGEIAIGGRSLVDVTVVGDLNTPTTRPPRDVLRYYEREIAYGITTGTEVAVIDALLSNNGGIAVDVLFKQTGGPFTRSASTPLFGSSLWRNDGRLSAEWVGSIASAVQIYGDLGFGDPIHSEDPADVYAFATDGSQPVVVEMQTTMPGAELMVRVIDSDGRTIAAPRARDLVPGDQVRLEFTPDAPGTYYIVASRATDGALNTGVGYVITVSGLAPTTLGAYRTGAGSGIPDDDTGDSNTITVLSGSVGAIRVGTMYILPDGSETHPDEVMNFPDGDGGEDLRAEFRGGTFSIPGDVFQVLTGGDFGDASGAVIVTMEIGGRLGQVFTGMSETVGQDPTQGDLNWVIIRTGSGIGSLDIRGAVGIDQDDPGIPIAPEGSVRITTGTAGGAGDIGLFRVGAHMGGDTLVLNTSPGSVIGAFLVSQDIDFDPNDPLIGIYGGLLGATVNMGAGSDLRFVDFPRIDLINAVNVNIPLIGGQNADFTDDAGGRLTVSVSNVPGGVQAGLVRALPVDGSQGIAIAQIVVDLSGGRALQLTANGTFGSSDLITIGHIIVVGSDAGSSIRIMGQGEIDIWRITATDGGLLEIVNQTVDGDIVAVDVSALTRLNIRGSLGRTELPDFGPALIGPFIGLDGDIALPTLDGSWNGELYRPENDVNFGAEYLDDLGGPFNPYLNGLIVRTGDVDQVLVGGAIGNVYATSGTLNVVTADNDMINKENFFEGIVGVIYALNIDTIDVGEGLAANGQSPIPNTGIFAIDDIGTVRALDGADLRSAIMASNINPTNLGGTLDGIALVTISGGGDIIDAYIGAELLDGWWLAAAGPNEATAVAGNLNELSGTDADFFRSTVVAADVPSFRLVNGAFDASLISANAAAGVIEATEFRNSTRTGTIREFFPSVITVGEDLGTLTTTGALGDISDLRLDVIGSVTSGIFAFNMSRFEIGVNNSIFMLSAGHDFRGSSINAGALQMATIANAIRTSEIAISGPIVQLIADLIDTTSIAVTGPDGRIDLITARLKLGGSISASGPIGTVQVTEGDMVATITTTTSRGNVTLLSAGRDLNIDTDISGNIASLVAGRHIGARSDPGLIFVRGNLTAVDVSNGQLYSDIRIGQDLVGTIDIGRVSNKPGADLLGSGSIFAFGRINAVNILGDFAGSVVSFSGGIGSVVITDGSFLDGGLIAAYDGDIGLVQINNGHLFGDVHADYTLNALILAGAGDFGDIGINPALSSSQSVGPFRNQLPPGVGPSADVQGPRITAGMNIGQIILTNGSIFEATIYAGRALGIISVSGSIGNDDETTGFGTHIAAGDLVFLVDVQGDISDTLIIAGVKDLGADGRLGGTGADADTIKTGRVRLVDVAGNVTNLNIAAGMVAGADGLYNTADDLHALGRSYVSDVIIGGTVTNSSAFADSGLTNAPAAMTIGGRNTPVVGGILEPFIGLNSTLTFADFGTVLTNGVAFNFTHGLDTGTITFTGPGTAIWDAANGRLILHNSTLLSTLVVTSDSGSLTSFDIVSNDDAMLGLLDMQADLAGDSDITIDGYLNELRMRAFSGSGAINVGNDIQIASFVSMTGGELNAIRIGALTVQQNLGGRVDMYGGATIVISGNLTGVISMDRSLTGSGQTGSMAPAALTVSGAVSFGAVRSADRIASVRFGSMSQSHLSARNGLGPVTILGNVADSNILAGADLGDDATFGGSGDDADLATTASIASVTISGNFTRSSIIAGGLRGPDGYYGTSDDSLADGRSHVGNVVIGGTQVGSNLNSESFRVAATGTVGTVTRAGQPITASGNFAVTRLDTNPLPIQVTDRRITEDSGIYTARLTFNQEIDTSTLGAALSVSEVRGSAGQITTRLNEGLDYTLEYDADENALDIIFNRDITQRDLPQVAGVPGPGIYRFELDAELLRAAIIGARLDGDGDGVAEADDHYSSDDIVGDAGDKQVAEQITVINPQTNQPKQVDAYAPINLDIVLDDNLQSNGVADVNQPFTLRGSIGDHPDNDTNTFRFAGDVDVYSITLQAGQIIRLGEVTGGAFNIVRGLYTANGDPIGDPASDGLLLPGPTDPFNGALLSINVLIKETGTYYLVVAATDDNADQFIDTGSVPNTGPISGAVGSYAFTLEVFDDGDSGFSASTNSGNGEALVEPPVSDDFRGPDQTFGTADDPDFVEIGSYRFTLDRGPDNQKGTSDDVISATLGNITITRAGGIVSSTVASAIGKIDFAGVPGNITPDVDVYHLFDRGLIQPGSVIRVTVKLSEFGTDLGSRTARIRADFSGQVQLGIFETTNSSSIDDALLVLSPTDFGSTGGVTSTIAESNNATYGYDANGDFFIEFLAPGALGSDPNNPDPASYAVYLQGVFNGNYTLLVEQGTPIAFEQRRQNVFLETRGGIIDWLEAGGQDTELAEFSTRVLGFSGSINNMPVETFVRTTLVNNLNEMFAAAGLDVVFSTNPAQFEFQDFSTVFLSTTNDPLSFFNDEIYGFAEHSDPFNADRNDEAVVFAPSFAALGYTPSTDDIEDFTDSLTAAVARRVGELMGLRITSNQTAGATVDPMAANSVRNVPTTGGVYRFPGTDRPLSTSFDTLANTDFYLGNLNSASLLDAFVAKQ